MKFFPTRARTRRVVAASALLLTAGATAAVLWLQQPEAPPPLVWANDYSGRPTACLAADNQPSTAPTAAGAWSAMQTAAKGTSINLQQLTVPTADPNEAATYLKGLAAQHCTLIVTVGAPGAAITSLLKADTRLQFIAIASTSDPHDSKVTVLTASNYSGPLTTHIRNLTADT